MTTGDSNYLGELGLLVGLDVPQQEVDRVLKQTESKLARKVEIPVGVTLGGAEASLKKVQVELDRLAGQSTKTSREQAAAARSLEQQYKATGAAQVASSRAAAAESAAGVAKLREQAAASRALAAESAANAAKIREQAAAYTLSARMAAQSAREQQAADRASISSLSDQQRAYRNLWRARQLSDDEVIEAQRRIYQQALLQAQAVDKQSEAYRRLTQVMASAQGAIDNAQGLNTPGGFGAGISQGILQALGNLGPFGQLLEQIVSAGMQAAQDAAREGARDVAKEAGAGLQAGLAGQAAKTRQAAMNLADQVKEGAEDALDIHSPSRVMRRVGQFAGDGLADGLLSKRAEVAAAAKTLANDVEMNGTPDLGGISGGGMGGVAVIPSAQAGLGKVAAQAALATAALGGTALAVGAVAAGMVNGAQKAVAFEQGLAEISTLTDKLPEQLGNLGNKLLKMTTDVGRSFADLKAGYEEILGASLKGTESEPAALKFLERSAQLAKVTRTETKVAADALTSVLAAYEMDATQATRVSDMLWASIAAGKVRLEEIAGSLGAVAGQASGLDVPLEELLGAMALLTTRGIPASTALEYIRSALTNVQKPSKEASGTAKELGIQFDAAALKSMGLVKFLDQLGRGVGDNSEALATLIGDVGGLQAVMGLLNGGLGDTDGILRKVTNSTGELDRQVEKLRGTAKDNVDKFNAAWERTQILFSGGVLSAFTGLLEKGINPLLTKLGDLKTAMNEVKSPGELKATLKIDWAKDDGTTMALKFIGGMIQGTGDLFGAIGTGIENSGFVQNIKKLQAFQLQQELQNRGLIKTPAAGDIGGLMAQYREISSNMAKYQQILADALKASTEAVTGLQSAMNQGNPFQPQPAQPLPEGVVGGLVAIAKLGALRSGGTRYGQLYDPDQDGKKEIHNGEDLFAKVGTPVMASFSGMLETRWSTTTGRILELVDAQGKRMLLGHMQGVKGSLEGLPKDIQAAFQASGGKAIQVNAGQVIGYVGQTGTKANKQLGPGNAHVHLMAFDENGNEIDPKKANWTPGTTRTTANSTATAAKFKPASDQALITEARRILSKIEGYEKAGNLTAKVQAEGVLKAFTDSGPRAAAAVEYVRSQVKTASAEVSKFGQGYDALKAQLGQSGSLFKINDNAQAYIKSLDSIATAAKKAADAEKAKNGETDKYRALLDLAGDAAGKARQQREGLKRDQDAAARDAATATANRIKTQQDLQKALADGREQDARRALQSLKDQQAAELALAQNSAARRAQIIAQTGPAILAAEDRIANLKRDQAVKAAQQAYDAARKLPGADLAALDATRREAVRQAYATATAERAAARREQTQAERQANQTALQAQQQHERERKAILARNAEEGRNLTISAAEQRLAGIKAINERELASFKGTAAERLRLIKQQSQAEYQAAVDLANAQKAIALQRLANQYAGRPNDPNYLEAVRQVREAHAQTVAQLGAARAATVQAEVDREKRSVQELRDEYSKLADTLREKITAGTVTQEDLTEYWQAIVRIGQAGQEAGVSGNKFLQSAQLGAKGVHALAQGVIDAGNKLREFREEFERTSDEIAAAAEVTLDDKNTDDSAEIARLKKLGPGMLLNFLGGPGNDNFGDKFWTRFGEEGRAEFMAALNSFDADDFAKLPQSLLQAWAAQMGDDAQWAGVKAQVLSAIGKITDDVGRLADAKIEGQLKALDLQRAQETITEDDYLAQRTGILTTQETERWAREKKALEAKGYKAGDTLYELAFQEHQNRLTDIAVGGVKKRVDAEKEGQEETASILDARRNPVQSIQEDIDNFTALFNEGQLTAAEYAASLDVAVEGLEAMAIEAERLGNFALAEQFRAAAQNARELNPELVQMRQEMKAIADLGANFQKFTNGLGSLLRSFGANDLGSIADGLGSVVSEASKLPGQFREAERAWTAFKSKQTSGTLGDLLGNVGGMLGTAGAVVGAIGQIGDALLNLSPIMQKNRREWADLAQASQQAMGNQYIGGGKTNGWLNPYYDALKKDAEGNGAKANAGFWQWVGWTIFGGVPETLDKAAAEQLQAASQVFNEFGSSLYSTLESSLMDAITEGDFSRVADNVNSMLDRFVQQLYVRTLLAKSNLKNLVEALADEQARGGDTTDEIAAIRAEIGRVTGMAEAGAPSIPGYGKGSSGGSVGGSGSSYVGAPPVAQLGVPRLEVTFPEHVFKPLSDFALAVPEFRIGVAEWRQATAELRAWIGGNRNSGPPPLSGLGGLT